MAGNKRNRNKLKYPESLPSRYGLQILPDGKTVRKTISNFYAASTDEMMLLLQYLVSNPQSNIVPILRCEKLSLNSYSYDMPLLAKLSTSEKRLIDVVSELDYIGYPQWYIRQDGLNIPGRYKHPKLLKFLRKVIRQDMYYDLHDGNIMKDRYGNYKLIDLEGMHFNSFNNQIMMRNL